MEFVGLPDISQRPLTRHLDLDFKFQTGLFKSGLKTENLDRCQHIFGANSYLLHLVSAKQLFMATLDGQTWIQASTPIVVC